MSNDSSTALRERADFRLSLPLFVLGFCAVLLFGWAAFPGLLYEERSQPLDFNHKVHAKIADNGCDSCHTFSADARFTGIPGIEACESCHFKVEKGGENEVRLIESYLQTKTEIPWLVYARQPDSVFFSHAAHVKSADLACERCHGDIGNSVRAKNHFRNRLTGYSRDIWGDSMIGGSGMRMDDCVDCHQIMKHEGSSVQTNKEGCFVCHK